MAAANTNCPGSSQEELNRFFKTWRHSLFNLPEEREEKLRIMEFGEQMWYTDANFSAAAILLKKENISSAQRYISHACEKNPKSIHAWCNQGVYCLSQRPPQLQQAKEAAEKIQELLGEDKSKTDAKVEKAHWLYTSGRTVECRTGALQMFEEELTNKRGDHNYSLHYFYLKALSTQRKLLTIRREQKVILQAMVAQLTILAGSRDKTYELEMWTHLAEMQYLAVFVEIDLQELNRVTGCDKPDLLYCTSKMLEIRHSCPQVPIYSNFYYRVGNNFLHLSYKVNNKEERIEMLNKALGYSKEYLTAPASSFEKSPALCATVLLSLWAINYYEEHRDEVDKYVNERNRPESVFPVDGDARCWAFLAQCYYSATPDVSLTTRPYLEEARKHLEEAMKPGRPYPSVQYPRILMLLGETDAEVEKAFEKAKGEGSGVLWQAHQGMFYEEVGNTQKALEFYGTVDNNERSNKWKLAGLLSTNGLSRLETSNGM